MTIGKIAPGKHTTIVMGVGGFVGHHLARELHENGHEVIGVGNRPEVSAELYQYLHSYIECDLTDIDAVDRLPFEAASSIINLAGLANVGASFENPEEYMQTNSLVHTLTCDAVARKGLLGTRIIAVSTGAVYDKENPMPLTESSKTITEGSPYALSKLVMEQALASFRHQGLDIIIARPFNHTGPGQGSGFLIPDLAEQLKTAAETNGVIKVGNLKTKRDYTDVRDIACAYRLLAEAPRANLAGTYNICSGTSRSGEAVLEELMKNMRLQNKIAVTIDQSRIRPNDPANIYGSHELLSRHTGWQPHITFEQTLQDFVDSL